ncbi:MAG: hypothetical protein NXY57DRAFT_1043619 [Lentinula lateritia]|nr:MAG: hypothetical protein NXY57DRAFT_1043619 [Lentinula lateritia]
MYTPEPDSNPILCNDCKIVQETGLDYPGHSCPYPVFWSTFIRNERPKSHDGEDSRPTTLQGAELIGSSMSLSVSSRKNENNNMMDDREVLSDSLPCMEKFCLQAGLERRKNIPKSTRTMMAVVIQKPAKSSRSKLLPNSVTRGLLDTSEPGVHPDMTITRSGRRVRLTEAAVAYRATQKEKRRKFGRNH